MNENRMTPWESEHGTVDPAAVSDSQRRDPERWVESYTRQNATMLRRRALAASNGHGRAT